MRRWSPCRSTQALHLKSAVTALPDGTVVGWDEVVRRRGGLVVVPRGPRGALSHVVLLDGSTVLMSSAAPRTRALYEERGCAWWPVDVSEFEKLEGCVTCLSVRLRG